MKHFFGIIILLSFVQIGFSQVTDRTYMLHRTLLRDSTVYTPHYLDSLSKRQVFNIYKKKVNAIVQIMPYASFGIERKGAKLMDWNIPAKSMNQKTFPKQLERQKQLGAAYVRMLTYLYPYIDKAKMTKAILFFDERIDKLLAH